MSFVLLAATLPQPVPLSGTLTPGPATFTIDSSITAAPSPWPAGTGCSGPPAALAPGVPRCLTYRVTNQMAVPLIVQQITSDLDPAFPAPPSGCTAQDLDLPAFTGSLPLAAGATATSPGLPITLKNTDFNQDACQDRVLHLVFSGTAVHADLTQMGTAQGAQPGTPQGAQPGAQVDAQAAPRAGGPLAFTGTAVLTLGLLGCLLLGIGVLLKLTARRDRAVLGVTQ